MATPGKFKSFGVSLPNTLVGEISEFVIGFTLSINTDNYSNMILTFNEDYSFQNLDIITISETNIELKNPSIIKITDYSYKIGKLPALEANTPIEIRL
jgi:hypothetical protein